MMKSAALAILVLCGSTLFSDCESHICWVTDFKEKSYTEFLGSYDG